MNARTDPHLLQPEEGAALAGAAAAPAPASPGASASASAAKPQAPESDIPAGPSDAALAAAVVAWHNRNPLARRLQAADVGGMGTLSLPVALPPAPTGWRRWLQRGPWRPRLTPAFDEASLIAGLSPRQITAFAHRHADTQRPGPPDWPERVVPASAEAQDAHPRHLFSAAFKAGPGASHRVLIGPGPRRPVLGRRAWSRVRVGLASALLLGVAGAAGAAVWWWRGHAAASPMVAAPGAAASAAGPALAASASAHAPAHPAASAVPAAAGAASATGHADGAASATEPAASAAAPAASAAPALVPAAAHVAVEAHATAAPSNPRAAEAPHAPNPSGTAPPPQAVPATHSAAGERPEGRAQASARTAPASRHHALVSAPTWRRAELAAQRARLTRLMGGELARLQLDVLRLPEGEVLALWPLASQAEAEALASRLGREGLAMLAVDF